MGEIHINKEICLTIQPNWAIVHPHEPIPPNHTNHSIGKLDQSKWWKEIITKITNITNVSIYAHNYDRCCDQTLIGPQKGLH